MDMAERTRMNLMRSAREANPKRNKTAAAVCTATVLPEKAALCPPFGVFSIKVEASALPKLLTMAGLDPAIQRLDGRLKAAHGEI